ncbi:uncharacterized protein LOC131978649 [Centropristis striata]|uniref:uncharacterized protein LOC131978649 n=1 Tax=Centropristis striata TaxID=184440 RepID=UPI0027DF818E|nr:uncharacterized protein LOC131978649 [Centropristis striata]
MIDTAHTTEKHLRLLSAPLTPLQCDVEQQCVCRALRRLRVMMRSEMMMMLLLLLLCVSDGALPPCSVGPVVTVPQLSKVSVSCPPVLSNSSELSYQLLFNGSIINQIRLSEASDSAVSWFSAQFEVSVNVSGEFVCSRLQIYPPPYRQDCLSTVVSVSGELAANDSVPAANQSAPLRSSSVTEELLWAGCVVLLVYSLSITCIAIVIWRKMKRDDEVSHDYFNTRPGGSRKPC